MRPSDRPWRTYLIASLPAWLIAAAVALVLNRVFGVPAWACLMVLAVWVAADLAAYPRLRRFYTSEPASQRMIGEAAVAVSDLTPRGFVRIRGELWQAHAPRGAPIREGQRLRVRQVDGLELVVEPETG